MALGHNPSIVNSGLSFYYDMYNTGRSFKGKPSTNTCSFGSYNYISGNGTVTRNTTAPTTPPIGGYEIAKLQSNDGTDVQTILYTAGCDQVNGGVYTHSAYIYLAAGTYVQVGQHWNPWDYGVPNYIPRNVWTRVSYTLTDSPNNYGSVALCYNTDGIIYITASQYEQSSFATPFIGGANISRSNTQALIDLAQNNTITCNNLTYNSDNTFSFDGSSNYMTLGNVAASGNAARSIFAWVKASSASQRCIISTGTAANSQAFNLVTYGSNKIGVMGYNDDFYPSSGANIFDNIWHYVGAVANGSGTITTYVDGNQDNTGSITYATTGQNNYVGKSNHAGNENYWNGSISGVQIYDRALSAAEIAQNFNALRGRYGI